MLTIRVMLAVTSALQEGDTGAFPNSVRQFGALFKPLMCPLGGILELSSSAETFRSIFRPQAIGAVLHGSEDEHRGVA